MYCFRQVVVYVSKNDEICKILILAAAELDRRVRGKFLEKDWSNSNFETAARKRC